VAYKCLLQRRQVARPGQSFDSSNGSAIRRAGGQDAGRNRPSVHQHGAGAALAFAAGLLGARQPQAVPQRRQQCLSRICFQLVRPVIHYEPDGHVLL